MKLEFAGCRGQVFRDILVPYVFIIQQRGGLMCMKLRLKIAVFFIPQLFITVCMEVTVKTGIKYCPYRQV
jgi:hypothetical protein